MKKILLFFISLGILVSLAACSTPQAVETTPSPADPAANPQAMPVTSKLLIGTFLLEDTDQAVTPEQAQQLIILWKAVKSMSSADNVAQAELDALYTQIEETMTAEQITTIDSMNIDMISMRDLMEKYGITMGGNGAGSGSDAPGMEFEFVPGEGEMPGGGPAGRPGEGGGMIPGGGGPGGGGMPGGGLGTGTQLTESQRATLIAERGANTGSPRAFGLNLILVDPLIQLLEERAAE